MSEINEEKNINGFEKKASFLKKIKYALLVFLVFVILFFLVGYREDITIENIRYLLKYVDISGSAIGSDDVQTIHFDTMSHTVTDIFRSELVVLSKNELKTFDLSAKEGVSDTHSLANPTLSMGKKAFAVYDLGDKYYALYNSFSKIYEETTDYPVWEIVFSDSGDYCIITSEDGYRSVLRVYNSDFENKMNWYTTDKYVVCADVLGKRDTYVVAGCVENNESGDFLTSVVILRDGSDKIEAKAEFSGELILDVAFFDNGNICALTDRAMRTLDLSGKVLSTVSFSSNSLRMFEASGEYAALVLNEDTIGTEHRLIVLNDGGKTAFDNTIVSDLGDLALSEDTVMLLGAQSLACVDVKKGKTVFHKTDKSYSEVHPLSDKRAVLIYEDSAYVVSVK